MQLIIESFALVCLAFSVFAFFSFQLAGHGGERACTVYEGHVTFPGSTWSMFYLRKGCLAGSLLGGFACRAAPSGLFTGVWLHWHMVDMRRLLHVRGGW